MAEPAAALSACPVCESCKDIGYCAKLAESERQNAHHVQMRQRCSDDNVALSRLRNEAEQRASALAAQLGNLLARIHRDGGHYQDEHGTEKACADAETAVVGLLAQNDVLAARLAEIEAAAKGLRAWIEKRLGSHDVRPHFVLRAHEDADSAVLTLDAALAQPEGKRHGG